MQPFKLATSSILTIFMLSLTVNMHADSLTPMPLPAQTADKHSQQTFQKSKTVTLYPEQRKTSFIAPALGLLATSALLYHRLTAKPSSSFDNFLGDFIASIVVMGSTLFTSLTLVDTLLPFKDIHEKTDYTSPSPTKQEAEIILSGHDDDREIHQAKEQYDMCVNARNLAKRPAWLIASSIAQVAGILAAGTLAKDKDLFLFCSTVFSLWIPLLIVISEDQPNTIAKLFKTTDTNKTLCKQIADANEILRRQIRDAQEKLNFQKERFNEMMPLALERDSTHAFKMLRKNFMNQPQEQAA